jgi:hypothetical protein
MSERLKEIKENWREILFAKGPAAIIAALVVLGFSIGFIRESIKVASVS